MGQFLQAFLPTVAFMMVPFFIPIVAVAVGMVTDAISGANRAESVDDRVRSARSSEQAEPQAA